MSRLTVHVAARGNAFMGDIAAALVHAARDLGHEVPDVDGGLPLDDGSLHLVVAPHEFFRLTDAPIGELRAALARSVLVCTEQPGTPWFGYTRDLCRGARAVLDINLVATEALRSSGIPAEHLRLGGVPSMDATGRVSDRSIDVVFLGALDDRRAAILAGLAPVLDERHCELRLFAAGRPVGPSTPGLCFGDDKYDLLARSRVLLNLHRGGHDEANPYFEWARLLEAMANGCVVLTEPSVGSEPLVAGEHFVEADVSSMATALTDLLDDEASRAAIATAAHTAVLGPLALTASLAPVLDRLLVAAPSAPARRVAAEAFGRISRVAPRPVFRPHLALQRQAKALTRRHDELLRHLDRVAVELAGGSPDSFNAVSSPGWAQATAEVSVLVTLYNYEHLVSETLASVVATTGVDIEVIVVDDASTDDSRAVAERHLAAYPELAWTVVSKACNQGLSAGRNTGFALARCPLVMVLDADNLLHPHGVAKLKATLDDAPHAAGAYGILDDFGEQVGLRSASEWDVDRLCAANYIDAQALLRRDVVVEAGGYRPDDDEVYGWEDWDLWLGLAAAGRAMAFCPQIVGSYRTQVQSMVSLSNVAADDMRAAIRRRYPALPWPGDAQ